jgi:hypothetical protein
MTQIIRSIFIVTLITFSQNVIGQQIGTSPYSQFGIGDLANEGYSRNVGMAGAGLASSSSFYINHLNPALNTSNNTVIYEFGIIGEIKKLQTKSTTDNSTAGNLNYIAFSFPLKFKLEKGKRMNLWTMGLGLKPFSTSSFSSIYTTKIINDTNLTSITRKGSGGTNQVYISNGIKINNNFTIGLTSSYLFGPIIRESETTVLGTTMDIYQKNNVSSFIFKPAINFRKLIGSIDSTETKAKTFFSFATTVDINTKMYSTSVSEINRIRQSDGTILNTNALNSSDNFSSSLPNTYNVGFAFENYGFNQLQKWTISTDFSFADWSKYTTFENNAGLKKYYHLKIGGEYTPTYVSTKSFLNRITYRAGLYFIQTPIVYQGNDIVDFGASLGLAFSIPKTLTNFNIGVTAGQKGTTTNNSIQEQYIRLYLGVNINDIWFFKRQLN